MRINFSKAYGNTLAGKFIKMNIEGFTAEYHFKDTKAAWSYACQGKQGLTTFSDYLRAKGYNVSEYHLEPNKDLFMDVGQDWGRISRTSPSYGITIPDDDPKWVEFKLTNG